MTGRRPDRKPWHERCNRAAIEHIEQTPDIFLYLKPGWQLDGAHCFGEDRMADVWRTMRRVTACECDECKSLVQTKKAG